MTPFSYSVAARPRNFSITGCVFMQEKELCKSVVISVAMYDLYYQGVWGKLAALSMIQTVITFSVLSIARKLGGTRVIVS